MAPDESIARDLTTENPVVHHNKPVTPCRIKLRAGDTAWGPHGTINGPGTIVYREWFGSLIAELHTGRTRTAVYRLWSYDVWGNARDGFEVNDRFSHGEVTVPCREVILNPGTPNTIASWEPSDRDLSRVVGERGLTWDGETDAVLYAECKSNGRPACELEFLRWED